MPAGGGGARGGQWGEGHTAGRQGAGRTSLSEEIPPSLSHNQGPSGTPKGGAQQRQRWEGEQLGAWDGLGHWLLGLGWWTKGKVPEEIYSAALLRVDHPSGGRMYKSPGLLIGLSG